MDADLLDETTMLEATAVFAKKQGSVGFFAEVTVRADPLSGDSSVHAACEEAGSLETTPAPVFNNWKSAAVRGAQFALREVHSGARVIVTRIEGTPADTNPSIVAAATAMAVWKVLSLPPPAAALAKVNELAFSSWSADSGGVPNL